MSPSQMVQLRSAPQNLQDPLGQFPFDAGKLLGWRCRHGCLSDPGRGQRHRSRPSTDLSRFRHSRNLLGYLLRGHLPDLLRCRNRFARGVGRRGTPRSGQQFKLGRLVAPRRAAAGIVQDYVGWMSSSKAKRRIPQGSGIFVGVQARTVFKAGATGSLTVGVAARFLLKTN